MGEELNSIKPTIEDYILTGTVDYLIVKADSRFENSLQLTGENGKTINLEIDGELETPKHRCWGTVVAIPRRITAEQTLFFEDGKPVKMNEIQLCVELGDKIYFSYLALNDNVEIAPNYYAISYSDAICTVRNGEILPVGSHVLWEPIYPEGAVKISDSHGTRMGMENSFGMITSLDVQPKPFEARITHTGLPLKNRNYGVQVGQHAVIDKYEWGSNAGGKWEIKAPYIIEGIERWVCREKDVAWIFE